MTIGASHRREFLAQRPETPSCGSATVRFATGRWAPTRAGFPPAKRDRRARPHVAVDTTAWPECAAGRFRGFRADRAGSKRGSRRATARVGWADASSRVRARTQSRCASVSRDRQRVETVRGINQGHPATRFSRQRQQAGKKQMSATAWTRADHLGDGPQWKSTCSLVQIWQPGGQATSTLFPADGKRSARSCRSAADDEEEQGGHGRFRRAVRAHGCTRRSSPIITP